MDRPFDTKHRIPDERRVCPLCSDKRSTVINRQEKVMSVWFKPNGSETTYCHHCAAKSVNRQTQCGPRPARTRTSPNNMKIAHFLWRSSQCAIGTPVETYLQEGRGIQHPPPATIRYLPARNEYPHAMITAFGLFNECEPGTLTQPRDVKAIHITRLSLDGLTRLEKRMLGSVEGQPLVLAPPNDGLGLVVTEGIEDALSVHEATGLGAWAAGSASHMRQLAAAFPDHIEHVLIIADDDDAGQKNSLAIASELLARNFEVTVKTLTRARPDG